MIYETYTCSMQDGTIEYGFCFKEKEGDDDCCTDAEIIIGFVNPLGLTRTQVSRELRKGWKKYEWMAKAIVAAAPMPKAPTKTVTIERYHVFGTRSTYVVRALYRGRSVTWSRDNLDTEDLPRIQSVCKAQGFTHANYVGDWGKRTKPKDGAL